MSLIPSTQVSHILIIYSLSWPPLICTLCLIFIQHTLCLSYFYRSHTLMTFSNTLCLSYPYPHWNRPPQCTRTLWASWRPVYRHTHWSYIVTETVTWTESGHGSDQRGWVSLNRGSVMILVQRRRWKERLTISMSNIVSSDDITRCSITPSSCKSSREA